jgi:hypothetical protein
MQPIDRTRGERREGIVVAVPGAEDEVSLHRTPGSWRAQWPRPPIMSRLATESFHLQRTTMRNPKADAEC